MRHALLRLSALLVVLMLTLTGCNLIGIDPIMQLDEDFAALNKKYSGVVATYDGGQITQNDVMPNLMSMYSMYNSYGINVTESILASLEQSVVENAVQNVAIAKQIEARGLKLSDEKLAEIEAETDEHYQEAYDSVYSSVKGETEEVRVKQTEYNLAMNGYTREGIYNEELAAANEELIEETVRNEIEEVTDDQLKEAFDKKVQEDEEKYAASLGSFESAMASASDVVCWMPEGYRTVKHILVVPDSEVLSAVTTARNAVTTAQDNLSHLREELDALNNADEAAETEESEEEAAEAPRTAEEIQADIDAAEASLESLKADAENAEADCLSSIQDKLDEIYGKIDAGEDFEALIETYGEDPGMMNEPTKTRGYYVCANSVNWDKNFTAGAMALQNVGDVSSTPVISTSGVHIIRYESDVTAGAVAYEDVKDALYDDTLESMKSDHYDSELKAWVEALKPEYNIAAFNLSND